MTKSCVHPECAPWNPLKIDARYEQWPLNISGNKSEMDTSTLLKSERICIIIPSLLCAPRASFTVTGLRRFRLCSVATDSLYRPASKKTCMLLYVSLKVTHLGNGTDTR